MDKNIDLQLYNNVASSIIFEQRLICTISIVKIKNLATEEELKITEQYLEVIKNINDRYMKNL